MADRRPAARIAPIDEGALDPSQRKMLDGIRATRGKAQPLAGPYSVWINTPVFGDINQRAGAHIRFDMKVPYRLREFAMLCVGQIWQSQFEFFVHEPMALAAGLSQPTIDDLRAGRRPSAAPDDELALYDLIHELYATNRVSDATYARLHGFVGDQGMVELIGVAGYYTLVSMTLNTFRVLPPPEAALPFPEPETP